MAKRKRRPGGGSKFRPAKDYRNDQYVSYVLQIETGILEAWTIDSDLRDGDVRQALRDIIKPIKQTQSLPPPLTAGGDNSADAISAETTAKPTSLIEAMVLSGLSRAFESTGPLTPEDVIGVLSLVNSSVGTWNRGMRGQEYLKYIKDFLGSGGVGVHRLSADEATALGLDNLVDNETIEGDYREIE